MNRTKTSKLLGYSIAATGDYAAYGFIFSFLSFFLTTVAGVSPSMSGVIISIAIAWDAITDPICGITMDANRSKYGKRRPFMLISSIPLGAAIALLFININASVAVKNVYYLIMVLVFWTAYTWFNIPYYSLGAVICKDDEERTKLAGIRQVFSFIGQFISGTFVTFLVGKLIEHGVAEGMSWTVAGLTVGIIVTATILISWRITRGAEPLQTADENPGFRELFSDIGSVMKNKPYLLLIAAALCFNVFMSFFNSNLMYYCVFNMGLNETAASTLFLVSTVTSIVTIPLWVKLGLVWDKKKLYATALGSAGIIMIAAKFIPMTSLTVAMVYMFLVSVATSIYWFFIFNLVYDCIDYDEAISGRRKDGVHMSFYSFLLKLGGAVASLVMGFMLEHAGFDGSAAVQSPEALDMIESMFTIIPAVFIILSALAMFASPLTKEKMKEIAEKLSNK